MHLLPQHLSAPACSATHYDSDDRSLPAITSRWSTLLRILALQLLLIYSLGVMAFEPPVERPAAPTTHALKNTLQAVAVAGERLVVAGVHGHILYSDDQGVNWQQAEVPVSEDLLALSFADDQFGLAVGHGGVILRTLDAGASWQLMLEGKQASDLVYDFYQQAAEQGAFADADIYFQRESFLREYGGTQSLMDVHCASKDFCLAVGIFNRLLISRDAGASWQPWSHRVDNPMELHFYAISPWNDSFLIAGEQGHTWVFNASEQYFELALTDYTGTLFGVLGSDESIIAHGMRGTVMVSDNLAERWEEVDTATTAGVTTGVVQADGTVVLGTLSGDLLVSSDEGASFSRKRLPGTPPIYSMAALPDGRLVIVGGAGFYPQIVTVNGTTAPETSLLSDVSMKPHNNKK